MRSDRLITDPIHTTNKLPMLKYVSFVLSRFYSVTLSYYSCKSNDHEHICNLLIHYDANNSLELPDCYTAVSTNGTGRQHGGPRIKRGAAVGTAK
jgi:hypothetical protein